MDRKQFEKAYEPNPHKSPFTEVKFDEVAQVYKPLDQFNPRIASSLNAAWYGWRIRQAEVDANELKLLKLSEAIYACGDLREYSDDELLGFYKDLKAILEGKNHVC
ncbi:hypothetical protein [Acinetobacter calcoaceticus]|uniref:hypothetical protein n=1 Tax=Acinetobacter calcoaceticus TaxID=471 RepID=UPI0018DE1AC7|nr:hypothetical protein [Acinetobacter calcoaceticus]